MTDVVEGTATLITTEWAYVRLRVLGRKSDRLGANPEDVAQAVDRANNLLRFTKSVLDELARRSRNPPGLQQGDDLSRQQGSPPTATFVVRELRYSNPLELIIAAIGAVAAPGAVRALIVLGTFFRDFGARRRTGLAGAGDVENLVEFRKGVYDAVLEGLRTPDSRFDANTVAELVTRLTPLAQVTDLFRTTDAIDAVAAVPEDTTLGQIGDLA